ncbi:MAG: class I SAM-dependent methyltransferase [Almyronema sp.]
MNTTQVSLLPFLKRNHQVDFSTDIPADNLRQLTPELEANRYFFNTPAWAKNYFEACHRSESFKARWLAATGSWDHKIVVDIGCGPGNLYATIGGHPQILIGVDVAPASLKMAQALGYTPLLADAHDLPLKSEFADIVALNATLHHCKEMAQVLREAARLVRPGGLLIVDHDPQQNAWNYKGLGMVFYRLRHLIYRYCLPSLDMPSQERTYALATEIHHHPGDGVTAELFMKTLLPRGFNLNLYPHNQTLGAEVLAGQMGDPPHWRYRLGQRLSGINPHLPEAALSLMCVAQRHV